MERLREAKLDQHVEQVVHCSATQLSSHFPENSFDAVILLGPLYGSQAS